MPLGTLFIDPEWYRSSQGKDVMVSLINRKTARRRIFGMLEKPVFSLGKVPEVFEYKLFVSGKCGVGKTAAVAKLTANNVPTCHCETPGIQMSTTYWPAKLTEVNRIVLFKLKFWDAGDSAMLNSDYVLPACKQHADAVVFVFAFNDKTSFGDLPKRMTRLLDANEDVCRFVIGSKLDLQSDCEVTRADVNNFEVQWQLKVLSLDNLFKNTPGTGIDDVASTLNFLCDQLWQRDKLMDGRGGTVN